MNENDGPKREILVLKPRVLEDLCMSKKVAGCILLLPVVLIMILSVGEMAFTKTTFRATVIDIDKSRRWCAVKRLGKAERLFAGRTRKQCYLIITDNGIYALPDDADFSSWSSESSKDLERKLVPGCLYEISAGGWFGDIPNKNRVPVVHRIIDAKLSAQRKKNECPLVSD
ncbi:hypothetical protein [Roseibium sp.]|uniref:hypothetical protein n=1 Tax=Roseibium sp. TaxID=1936156 RepID=UPI003D0DB24B